MTTFIKTYGTVQCLCTCMWTEVHTEIKLQEEDRCTDDEFTMFAYRAHVHAVPHTSTYL